MQFNYILCFIQLLHAAIVVSLTTFLDISWKEDIKYNKNTKYTALVITTIVILLQICYKNNKTRYRSGFYR